MPVATILPVCGNCGAPLDVVAGQSTAQCRYCKRTMYLSGTTIADTHYRAPGVNHSSVMDELSEGPRATPFGSATRLGPDRLPAGGVVPRDFTVLPKRASASSTYGGSWSPDMLLGPPNVFPNYGDRAGAWAPRSSRSKVEWIELEYDTPVPVSAIRVFETNVSGSTYAIVDRTEGDLLLWAAQPRSYADAQMLEVPVSPARMIRRLRVYVVNPGGWTEIDTVALITAEQLPASYARPDVTAANARKPTPRAGVVGAIVTFAAIAAICAVVAATVNAGKARTRIPSGLAAVGWDATATQYRGANGASFTIQCSAGGPIRTVWGTDVYSDDSSLCTAALHAGRISLAGGQATIEIRPGASQYVASTRNGVTTSAYGSWSGSFVVR